MTRYTLLDLLRDEPRSRETLSYRDLTLCRRTNDGGRYNVADAAGEHLCILDVGDYDSEGALAARLDDLSATADTDPAVIDPEPSPELRADGGSVGHAVDYGTLRDVVTEIWPFQAFGTAMLGLLCAGLAMSPVLPAERGLFLGVAILLAYGSLNLARAKGRRAYLEGES